MNEDYENLKKLNEYNEYFVYVSRLIMVRQKGYFRVAAIQFVVSAIFLFMVFFLVCCGTDRVSSILVRTPLVNFSDFTDDLTIIVVWIIIAVLVFIIPLLFFCLYMYISKKIIKLKKVKAITDDPLSAVKYVFDIAENADRNCSSGNYDIYYSGGNGIMFIVASVIVGIVLRAFFVTNNFVMYIAFPGCFLWYGLGYGISYLYSPILDVIFAFIAGTGRWGRRCSTKRWELDRFWDSIDVERCNEKKRIEEEEKRREAEREKMRRGLCSCEPDDDSSRTEEERRLMDDYDAIQKTFGPGFSDGM